MKRTKKTEDTRRDVFSETLKRSQARRKGGRILSTTARHFKQMLRVGVLAATLVTCVAFAAPLGLPPLPVPADNPITPEKVKLGDKLFHDKRFSSTGEVSCSTCHEKEKGFYRWSPGVRGDQQTQGHTKCPYRD